MDKRNLSFNSMTMFASEQIILTKLKYPALTILSRKFLFCGFYQFISV